MADLPIVCTLTPETIATRKAGLLSGLVHRAESKEDTADGIRLRLRRTRCPQCYTVDAERQCCRFLRFDITVEPGDGPFGYRSAAHRARVSFWPR